MCWRVRENSELQALDKRLHSRYICMYVCSVNPTFHGSQCKCQITEVVRFQRLSDSRGCQIPEVVRLQRLSDYRGCQITEVVGFQRLSDYPVFLMYGVSLSCSGLGCEAVSSGKLDSGDQACVYSGTLFKHTPRVGKNTPVSKIFHYLKCIAFNLSL